MPHEDMKRAAHRALVDRILTGEGRASAQQREQAFADDRSAPLHTLISKVTRTPVEVTDADLADARASGCTEDQLFELVICAAVGHSTRLYEAGLAALAAATGEGGRSDAS